MSTPAKTSANQRLLTIGTVTRRLQEEFPEISISKIRYLEDQGLLAPRRTQGGYRLFSEEDVERLETILRLQRDEFLPLRVIREELSSPGWRRAPSDDEADCPRPRTSSTSGNCASVPGSRPRWPASSRSSDSGAQERQRHKLYGEGDVDVAATCAKLARYGISARHLRTFRTAADREAGLLEQIVSPALRSRNPDRRQAGLDELQSLAELAQELSQLLFWRDLKQLADR
jgi:DNA-binding transcriptional MerR regulator